MTKKSYLEKNVVNKCMNNDLTFSDLADLRSIIEIAASRGAFQANELSQVGLAYDKLNQFLRFIEAQAQDEANLKASGSKESTGDTQ